MKWLLALALAALPQQQYPDVPAPRLRGIAMETHSWGRPVAAWTIDAAGNGRYTAPEPEVHAAKRLVTRSFAAGTSGFRRLRTLLGNAEVRAGRALPCIQRITDMVYGEVRWTRFDGRSSEFRFDAGCRDFSVRRVLAELKQADDLVAGWAANGPVVETKDVNP